MSNTVIYTNDLEPITIINLDASWFRYFDLYRVLRIPVTEPFVLSPFGESSRIERIQSRVVCLVEHRMSWYGQMKRIVTTSDEESALLLTSIFLPGQTAQLNEEKRRAYAEGFLKGLQTALSQF